MRGYSLTRLLFSGMVVMTLIISKYLSIRVCYAGDNAIKEYKKTDPTDSMYVFGMYPTNCTLYDTNYTDSIEKFAVDHLDSADIFLSLLNICWRLNGNSSSYIGMQFYVTDDNLVCTIIDTLKQEKSLHSEIDALISLGIIITVLCLLVFCLKGGYCTSFFLPGSFVWSRHARENNCCICLEGYNVWNVPYKLTCSHLFHSRCIIKWSETSNECPICKQNMYSALNYFREDNYNS